MGGVGVTLEYGRANAPRDVLDSLDWLAHEGFVLVGERGGPGWPFGDLLVEFERSALRIRITRDRNQWSAGFAAGRGDFVPLHVLLTAWQGGTPAPADRQAGDPLPEVHPEGVRWRVVFPDLVSWLGSGDRTGEIQRARAAWKAAMAAYWASRKIELNSEE
jgi:hypothetical protein